MAEQLGLDQVRGDGAAVDGDEGAPAPGAGLVDGAGEQFLAGAGLALDQDGDGARGGAAGAGDGALHGGAAVDDGVEFGGGGRQAEGEPLQRPVGALEQVGEEVGGDVEGDRGDAHAVLDRGLDQFGGEAGLGEDDPDRGHGGGAGAQMEGESVTRRLAGEGVRDDRAGVAVDGAEVGGAFQGDVMGGDGGWCLGLKPGEIGRGLVRGVVAEEFQPGEAAGLQGLGDGADADLVGSQ